MVGYLERNAVHVGDVRELAGRLEPGSVQTIVTSPPYFGLRDYGTGRWEGGDAACEHKHDTLHQIQGATSQRQGRSNVEAQRNETFRGTCGKCGAVRVDQQLGLESSPAAYVANLVAVFRALRPALKDDGTVWLNLGDSYTSGNSGMRVRDNCGGFQPGINTFEQAATRANPGRPPRLVTRGTRRVHHRGLARHTRTPGASLQILRSAFWRRPETNDRPRPPAVQRGST